MHRVPLAIAALVAMSLLPGCDRGPQIDPDRVVDLDDLKPISIIALNYETTHDLGWPTRLDDRAYIAFLQSKGVDIAFVPWEGTTHTAMISFLDSLRARKLHSEAAEIGLAVPNMPIAGRIQP